MKELSLKELQNEELNILKDVHEFCLSNNIRYSLYGGTLIGALRHKGFIPWDDDIDIIIPRPDYDRFCKEYKSANYKIADLNSNRDYKLGFARVYDDNRTTVVSTIPWLPEDVGVWIDVFPADGMSDKEDEIVKVYKKVIRLRKRLIKSRKACAKYSTCSSFKARIKLFVRKTISLNGSVSRYHVKQLDKAMRTYPFETSPKWASLSNVRGLFEHKHHSKETFQTCVEVDFEDMKALVMNGSDLILRERYSDYMKLPPENERIPKGNRYIKYYWKE